MNPCELQDTCCRSNLSYGRYNEGRTQLQTFTSKLTDAIMLALAFDKQSLSLTTSEHLRIAHRRFCNNLVHLASLMHGVAVATLRDDYDMDSIMVCLPPTSATNITLPPQTSPMCLRYLLGMRANEWRTGTKQAGTPRCAPLPAATDAFGQCLPSCTQRIPLSNSLVVLRLWHCGTPPLAVHSHSAHCSCFDTYRARLLCLRVLGRPLDLFLRVHVACSSRWVPVISALPCQPCPTV
jgi:hypothetical protein